MQQARCCIRLRSEFLLKFEAPNLLSSFNTIGYQHTKPYCKASRRKKAHSACNHEDVIRSKVLIKGTVNDGYQSKKRAQQQSNARANAKK